MLYNFQIYISSVRQIFSLAMYYAFTYVSNFYQSISSLYT